MYHTSHRNLSTATQVKPYLPYDLGGNRRDIVNGASIVIWRQHKQVQHRLIRINFKFDLIMQAKKYTQL